MKSRFLFLLCFFLPVFIVAQNNRDRFVAGKLKQRRLALIIGNADYQFSSRLATPLNDAQQMAAGLYDLGFEVMLLKNGSKPQMDEYVQAFFTKLKNGRYPVALFYYSGHGMQIAGRNFLLPVEANPQGQGDIRYNCLDAQKVMDMMGEAGVGTKIMLLDACRNNPQFGSITRTNTRGLAFMNAPEGSIIGFATAPGQVVNDEQNGNSSFTGALLEGIQQEGLDILPMTQLVVKRTRELAGQEGKTQNPFWTHSLGQQFFFKPSGTPDTPVKENTSPATQARVAENNPGTNDINGNNSDRDGDGTPDQSDSCPDVPGENNGCPERREVSDMVFVKGGSFQMGDLDGSGDEDEKPAHQITMGDFYLGIQEVTFEEYDRYCQAIGKKGPDDGGWGRGQRPVINVSWNDAIAYCNWRSVQENLQPAYTIDGESVTVNWGANGYRLPSEAEWEYAARSGGRTEKWSGTSDVAGLTGYANFASGKDGYKYATAPVRQFQPNGLGIFDMSGNVWEWCWDWYHNRYYSNQQDLIHPKGPPTGRYRISRGGSWKSDAEGIRAANRNNYRPDSEYDFLGFRLARSRY